jgi:Holliday junction resolvasome RuvABC endonuclease subunit
MKDPTWGTIKVGRETFGQTGANLRDWLVTKIVGDGVTEIVVEDPFVSATMINNVARLYGLRGIVEEVAWRRNISVQGVAVASWRKAVLGVVRAPKTVPAKARGAWIKDRAMQEMARRGWPCRYHDEADALGVLVWYRAQKFPEWAACGSLFGVHEAPPAHPDSVHVSSAKPIIKRKKKPCSPSTTKSP